MIDRGVINITDSVIARQQRRLQAPSSPSPFAFHRKYNDGYVAPSPDKMSHTCFWFSVVKYL